MSASLDELVYIYREVLGALGEDYDHRLPLRDNVRHLTSKLASVTIERDHWRAMAEAVSGMKSKKTSTAEGLDGQWLSETGVRLPSEGRGPPPPSLTMGTCCTCLVPRPAAELTRSAAFPDRLMCRDRGLCRMRMARRYHTLKEKK